MKKIKLLKDSYKGVDGSSLSSTRCSQIVQVYEMLENLGTKQISYLDIQKEAARLKLFGNTKAKSAIRTFFPLLKKIGFVNYDDLFPANKCFTTNGKQFVAACRALENVTKNTPNKDEIISRLNCIKQDIQCIGLLNMYNNPEYKNHNIWIALKLLKVFKILHWNEFLYTLHLLEEGCSVEDAIIDLENKREEIHTFVFVNENGEILPNTCYSYIRSFLEESGLICNVSSIESKLLDYSDKFYSQIDL